MVLPDVITLVSLLSLGGIMAAAGLLRLSRLDRLHMEHIRQDACRWHRWQVVEEGTALICALCGKRSRRVNPPPEEGHKTLPSGGGLP